MFTWLNPVVSRWNLCTAYKFGPEGAGSLAKGIVTLTKKTEMGSPLRRLNLMASRMRNKGAMAVAGAMGQGGMTRLESLNMSSACRRVDVCSRPLPHMCLRLAANNIQHRGITALSKSLTCKRHRGMLELDLSYNGFGDPGVEALAEAVTAGALPALERLRLACTCDYW